MMLLFFFFKQKTAYEMRISDWSSDVCSSDLRPHPRHRGLAQSRSAAPALRGARKPLDLRLFITTIRHQGATRVSSEERRVGKECVSTCRSRWSPYHKKKKNTDHHYTSIYSYTYNISATNITPTPKTSK